MEHFSLKQPKLKKIKFDHFWILKFHNFVPNHSLSMKLLQLAQKTVTNVMYFTELPYTEVVMVE